MTKLDELDLREQVSRLDMPGVGLVYDGFVRFEQEGAAPCKRFCSTARERLLTKECARYYAQFDPHAGAQRLTCPAGFEIVFLPLTHIAEKWGGIVVHAKCGPNSIDVLPRELVAKLGRKDKKHAKRVLAEIGQWENPQNTLLETKLELASGWIQERLDTKREDAFEQTVFDYRDFVASFSHEALNPIQEIGTTLERAASRLQSADAETLRLVGSAARAVVRVRTSLEGMRLLFNQEQRPLANQFQQTDVRRLVQQWAEVYEAKIGEKNLELIIEPRGPWMLSVVKESFEVLVANLLNNAVKYSFDARTYDEPGKLVVRFDPTFRRISFINFGVAISEEEITTGRLFQLSRRGTTSSDRGRPGKGVGLYLVKLVAVHHNAKIDVVSKVMNPGGLNPFARNEFSVTLPKRAH